MKEKKIAREARNKEKLAGDDWVMAEFCNVVPSLQTHGTFGKGVQKRNGRYS